MKDEETVSLKAFRQLEAKHKKLEKAYNKLKAAVNDVVEDPMLDPDCKEVLEEGLK